MANKNTMNQQDDLLALIDEMDIDDLKANFGDIMAEVIASHGDNEEQREGDEVVA